MGFEKRKTQEVNMNEYERSNHWYCINLKQPYFLADKDYQNYVLFKLFQHVKVVDVSLMEHPYHSISALFESREHAESFSKDSAEFVQSIQHSVDRGIMSSRTYMERV